MAEQDTELTRRHTEGDKTQSTNLAPDECKQANNDLIVKQTEDSALSSVSINNEGENTENADDKNSVSSSASTNGEAEKDKNVEQAEDDHTGGMEAPGSTTQDDQVDVLKPKHTNPDAGGDSVSPSASTNGEAEKDKNVEQAEDDHTGGMEAPGSTTQDEQVDVLKPKHTNPDAGGDSVSSSASTNSEAEKDKNVEQAEKVREEQIKHVETIGPASQTTEPIVPEASGILAGRKIYLIAVIVVPVVAILLQHLHTETPPQINDIREVDIFLKELEKVKAQFPNQRAELWNRSRIHLQRHLQTAQPTEPVSLILTAGLRAERTLRCLARDLASAFSSALNASVLHIDGASIASQDSDQVKLDIDNKLQRAFEGDKPVAVIHRFEELPPGSTLIFYRYCDHENAAFKKTFLIFTVLLGEEEAIPAKIRLSAVEEMVDDHLQNKFLTHGHPVSFDRMDLDKYGGLWSRISHLILPVASEETFEREGCKGTTEF